MLSVLSLIHEEIVCQTLNCTLSTQQGICLTFPALEELSVYLGNGYIDEHNVWWEKTYLKDFQGSVGQDLPFSDSSLFLLENSK